MPKVKNCEYQVSGIPFSAVMNVDNKGVFSVTRPGAKEDWPDDAMKMTGKVADELEAEWRAAARDLAQRTKVERKVIIVRFDSTLRVDGAREITTSRREMMFLCAGVAMETTIQQGKKTQISYREHPDYAGWGKPQQPFPILMRLDQWDYGTHVGEDWTVVDWTQELQDALVNACLSLRGIVSMLDRVLSTPEQLKLAVGTLLALPAPPDPQDREEEEE